jgi:RecA/RadA recombinase
MTITFTGDKFSSTQRVKTGFHSLDWALGDSLGNIGWPLKSVIEAYGPKNVGKTTFCVSLMGVVARELSKNTTILDWEGQSKETIEGVLNAQGFSGNVNYLLNVGDESSEDTLERFVGELLDDGQNIALVDSIGGFRPTALLEGKIGDANMGVFARETGQFVDKLVHVTNRSKAPGVIFMTNHIHPTIGSMMQGQDTSGGVKKKYLAHVRIDLKRAYLGNSAADFGESWLLKGRIDSSRFGYSKREFYVFMIGGEGIHLGLSAVWDCVIAKHATLSAKSISESNTVAMEGQSYGKMGKLIRERADDDLFRPFINRLLVEDVPVDSVSTDEVQEEETPKKKRKK